jgi:hypothetical protein
MEGNMKISAMIMAVGSLLFFVSTTMAQPAPEQLIGQFQKALMKELKLGLQQGPTQAIKVCQIKAPQIAAQLSTDQIAIGRSTTRLRNPDNQAPHWVAEILAGYQTGTPIKESQTIDLLNGKQGYIKPIYIRQPCLKCHGTTIAPDIAAALNEYYPNDQATGYKAGDFRGVFWVETQAN